MSPLSVLLHLLESEFLLFEDEGKLVAGLKESINQGTKDWTFLCGFREQRNTSTDNL